MAASQVAPAPKDVRPQLVEMKVPLYSYGCEKKMKKALSKLKGIHSVHVDYDHQKVTVWGICNRDDVLSIIKRKRREARFWGLEGEHGLSQNESSSADPNVAEQEVGPGITEKANLEGRPKKLRKQWKNLLPLRKGLR